VDIDYNNGSVEHYITCHSSSSLNIHLCW